MRAWSMLALLLLAGCTQAPVSGPEALPWAALALPHGAGHDHSDPAHHRNGTTPTFVPLGHDPMTSLHYGATAGGYLCGDVQDTRDGRRLAAVESRSDVGFALVDVTDPADPEWLGELVMENAYVYDLAVVPDGRHVVLATTTAKGVPAPVDPLHMGGSSLLEAPAGSSRTATAPDRAANAPPTTMPTSPLASWADAAPASRVAASPTTSSTMPPTAAVGAPRLSWTTPCGASFTSDPLPYEDLLLLVDISDPTAPRVVQALLMLGHGHSAFAVDMDGTLIVLAVTLGPDAVNSWAHLYRLDTAGGQAALVPLSIYKGSTTPDGLDATMAQVWHDGWIAKHPGTGDWLLHLVGGHAYTVLDLDDPARPSHLATWRDDDPAAGLWTGNLHSVVPLTQLWDGRHYTVIGPEWGSHPEDHPSGILRVLDTTDPAVPSEVGAWTLPVDVEWDDGAVYQFSNHYYAIDGQVLFASMYHGGVWAVDLSPVGSAPWVNLPTLGVWQPLAPDIDSAVKVRWAPTNQEVFARDGTIITFDSNTGLHTATFDPSVVMPAPAPWPLSPLAR